MFIAPDHRRSAARLFALLRAGELVAERVAGRQATLVEDPFAKRFCRGQARQEAFHSRVFDKVTHILCPKGVRSLQLPAMPKYQALLDDALARGDIAESLLGQQVIREAFGEVLLTAVDRSIQKRGLGFGRLRRIILAQEEAHHATGNRLLEEMIADHPTKRQILQTRASDYLELIEEMFTVGAPLFLAFDEDPAEYRRQFKANLPGWVSV